MDKKSLIAVVLSAIVIFSYPYIMKRFFPPHKTEAEQTVSTQKEKVAENELVVAKNNGLVKKADHGVAGSALEKTSAQPTFSEKIISIDTPLYRAEVTSLGGGIKSWNLKKYNKTADKASGPVNLVASPDKTPTLRTRLVYDSTIETAELTSTDKSIILAKGDRREVVLRGVTSKGLNVEKRYLFTGSDYLVKTELRITNGAKTAFNGFVDTTVVKGQKKVKKKKRSRAAYHEGGLVSIGDKVIRHKDKDPGETRNADVKWIGVENKYFLSALIPITKIPVSWRLNSPVNEEVSAVTRFAVSIAPGETALYSYNTFMGPKKYDLLVSEKSGLQGSVEFGYFSFMAKPLLHVLNFLQSYVVNYGIAIIVLTIVIKLIFYPLTHHGLKSMNGMKKVQPQIAAIKERYKDDKARLNKEIMALYKKYKINPVGGCLPMILQIPVFIALYEVLYVCIELRHAPFFLWIHDLSAQDPYYITPLIMGGSMFLQQKMTPTSVDPTQAKMMLFMPVIFTVMFLKFPSGLVIYWLVNNILSIAQQYYINKTDTAKI